MVSNKSDKPKRRYELKARARKQEETRRRITEAAVELHGTVGPAKTTVQELARRAGVRRMTVYNHFPSDRELMDACSSHWFAQHPPPDPTRWSEIPDPDARCREALAELYAWYAASGDMMENSLRDAALVPALASIMEEKWWPYVDGMVQVLAAGRKESAALGAVLRLVVDFGTWRTLTGGGLDSAMAAALAADLVRSIARS